MKNSIIIITLFSCVFSAHADIWRDAARSVAQSVFTKQNFKTGTAAFACLMSTGWLVRTMRDTNAELKRTKEERDCLSKQFSEATAKLAALNEKTASSAVCDQPAPEQQSWGAWARGWWSSSSGNAVSDNPSRSLRSLSEDSSDDNSFSFSPDNTQEDQREQQVKTLKQVRFASVPQEDNAQQKRAEPVALVLGAQSRPEELKVQNKPADSGVASEQQSPSTKKDRVSSRKIHYHTAPASSFPRSETPVSKNNTEPNSPSSQPAPASSSSVESTATSSAEKTFLQRRVDFHEKQIKEQEESKRRGEDRSGARRPELNGHSGQLNQAQETLDKLAAQVTNAQHRTAQTGDRVNQLREKLEQRHSDSTNARQKVEEEIRHTRIAESARVVAQSSQSAKDRIAEIEKSNGPKTPNNIFFPRD